MDSLKRISLAVVLVCAAGAALAAVFAPSIAMTGGDNAMLMTSINSSGGTSAGAAFTHTYTVGAPATIMSGGGFTLAPGPVNTVNEAKLTLDEAHAFPNPYKPSSGHFKITFTELEARVTISLYTLSGRKVVTLTKDDPTDSFVWTPVVNDHGSPLASGVYPFFIKSVASGHTKRGKLMIIK
jgi:hypothetical protein